MAKNFLINYKCVLFCHNWHINNHCTTAQVITNYIFQTFLYILASVKEVCYLKNIVLSVFLLQYRYIFLMDDI